MVTIDRQHYGKYVLRDQSLSIGLWFMNIVLLSFALKWQFIMGQSVNKTQLIHASDRCEHPYMIYWMLCFDKSPLFRIPTVHFRFLFDEMVKFRTYVSFEIHCVAKDTMIFLFLEMQTNSKKVLFEFFTDSPQHKNANTANFVLAVPLKINKSNNM